ncbi:glycosyltransferase [Polaribacter vadi]|uniref:glycosyltransferase family 4 protein n=1 Tax=Polaribacter TaxID=52959 RepID=UPI001C082448|nr:MULTISPECIES: glycosyltransferase [Polaribacter]MBU3010518.1 glycosyltransferase [Polaribacter vadi]MDO6740326.1 glycosyltransferase [Polaribacter sp. 1_MG-2023]
MPKKLKILISCYACSPKRGSEPGMGWSFVLGLSKQHEVHVIVEKEKWQKDIEVYLEQYKNENLKFYFIHKKRNRLLRKIWPPSYYWFYKIWQKEAYNLAKKLEKKHNFDAVHQLNMVGYREPGFLWKMDIPFVWGPIGGTENIPWKLFSLFSFYGKIFYGGRNIINSYQRSFFTRPKLAANHKKSSLIAATPDIKKSIKKLWNSDAVVIPEVGAVELSEKNITKRDHNKPLKIVWSGQHTSGKALHLLLKSLVLLNKEISWELHILGVGKETKKWQQLSKKLDINKNCFWYGWLDKSEALQIMKNGHCLAITSLKDLTSSVIIEGISLGLPVVTLDHCGFSFVVDDTCGIKIPVDNPNNIYINFKNALEKLYENESYRVSLSEGALKRAKDFSWDSKIDQLNEVYQKLVV